MSETPSQTPAPQEPTVTEASEAAVYAPKPYRPTPPKGTPGSGRYALWDTQEERYVGEVTTTKPKGKAHHVIVEV